MSALDFSAALLAGGESRRMGRDKADLLLGGVPLWQRQLDTLRATGAAHVMISGTPRPAWAGWTIVPDTIPGAGPLAGLAACLRRCATPRLLVLAVDMPRMTAAFLRSLARQASGVVPEHGGHLEPLAAIYPAECALLAEECLRIGERSMHAFVARAVAAGLVSLRPLTGDELALFTNLNTPDDLT